jgi:hypothetical protein
MAEDHPASYQVEIDQALLDITFHDETAQPVGPLQVAFLVDRATGQVMNWWLKAPAALLLEEPPTMP